MKVLKLLAKLLSLVILVPAILNSRVNASDEIKTQLTFNTGMVQGSYSSPLVEPETEDEGESSGGSNVQDELEGGFSVVPSVSLVLEGFTTSFRKSWFIRTVIAMNSSTGKMNYNFLGGGRRYYYSGFGIPRSFTEKGFSYSAKLKTRKYYGWDVGLSRVLVASFSKSLSAVSTGIDFGGHWGLIKQLGENWGLNFELGASFAYGFSTVAVSGTNIKIFVGGTYGL